MKQKERLIAEAMGLRKSNLDPERYCIQTGKYKVSYWQPPQDAEQCIIVLEWYIYQTNITQALDRVTGKMLYDKVDFKTAVVLAAAEYIEQNENQK